MKRSASLLAGVAALSACRAEPESAPPPLRALSEGSAAVVGSVPLSAGWAAFGSPELESLIAHALTANADVAVGAARITQARGTLGAARAASLPRVSASADAYGLTGVDLGRPGTDAQSLGIDIAYDVDLFGAARAGRRAAAARLAASRHDRDAVALAVSADVARGYVQHAALGARLDVLARALANARELERIVGVRVREGAATRVDAGLQRIVVSRIEAEMSRLAEARARTRNALAVLVGVEAPRFALAGEPLDRLSPPAFAAEQPGLLLVRRPDIRSAEARIAAARGDVGQARAALLPSLRIGAGSLLGAGSGGPLGLAFTAGSSLLAPIFDGGRLRGRLLTARGAQVEAAESYRGALLVAARETEDALAGIAESRRREALLGRTLEVARTTARLARRQYAEGAADLQVVLDAEQGALDVEDAAAVAAQDRLVAAIDLYRALGGPPA